MTYISSGCCLKARKLTSQSSSITLEFSVSYNLKVISVIHYLFGCKGKPNPYPCWDTAFTSKRAVTF